MGASASLPVTLSNSGNSNVDVTNVSISGAGFAPSGISTGQILAPGSTTMSVTFTPAEAASATGTVTITSNATNSPTTVSLSGTGTQPTTYSVSLTWSPSTSSVVGYNVYRGTSPGGESLTSPINGPSLVGGESYSDTNVVSGTTYYYVVTAVNATGVQSADSTEASADVP
jgi:fibronectin type 3 domain-containing protein